MSQVDRLRITEIFYSLQGEAETMGLPTVFIRLTGCPLRCEYCDTSYAFQGGEWFTYAEILQKVSEFKATYVCVTGGEPLAQKQCTSLLKILCDNGYQVSLETSGAMDISTVDPRVSVVMDVKTPGSGESTKNRLENLSILDGNDQLKFVICSRDDYEWSRHFVQQHQLEGSKVIFSPSFTQISPRDLAEWVLADRVNVRVQVQLHKILWGEEQGR